MCYWLRCSWNGCRVRSSLKIGHYNPDLVVAVYNELGANPWVEARTILGPIQRAAANGLLGSLFSLPAGSAGNRTEGRRLGHTNLIFREADAIGHPLDTLSDLVADADLLCPSQASTLVPYFQSALDAVSWRSEIPEAIYPASLIPGLREISRSPLQTWGSVHPRTGWVTQTDEAKAAAVIAQRATDIVTRTAQPHVYVPLQGASGSGRWPPGPLLEVDRTTGVWQRLHPDPESSCDVFGTDDLTSPAGWGAGKIDDGGDYVWNLWRPYECCRRRGQWFLYDIEWISYPP